MRTRFDPPPALLGLAARQASVVTQEQLAALGVPAGSVRRWKQGWVRLAPGLYRLGEPSFLGWCWAGLLQAGGDAVVGGLAACHLQELSARAPGHVTIWHSRNGGLVPLGDRATTVRFRRGVRDGRGTPRRTAVEQSIVDAAAEADEEGTVAVALRALAQGLTLPGRLLARLEATGRVSHRRALLSICGGEAAGVESVLEWRFLLAVVRAHGLPEPARQVSLAAHSRTDCHWADWGVVAELDGRLGHEEAFRDMWRDNGLVESGLTTLRYGWVDLITRPCAVAAQVHRVLALHGYAGRLRTCPGCR